MILVSGATGFVGRHLVRELVARGKRVRCLVRRTSNLAVLEGLEAEICYGDVLDPDSLREACSGAEAVIHLVAVIRERKGATFEKVNYEGTRNLVEAAKGAGVGRFLYISNLGTSANPDFPFLYSKWQAEEEVRGSGLDYTILRFSLMFGEGDGFILPLARLVTKLPLVPVKIPLVPIIGPGKTRFQLISVADAVSCIALALEDERTIGETILLGGPEHLTYEEIVDLLIEVLKLRRLKVHVPLVLMRPPVWLMERLLPHPLVTSAELAMLEVDNITELDAVERYFGFKPTPLGEGLGYLLVARNRGQL